MSDLLDLLASLETTTHVLMPCMAYACGRTMLEAGCTFQVGIVDWAGITCDDCRAVGRDELVTEMRRQQGEQQAVGA